MDITPFTPKDRPLINRYGNGGFVINETPYQGNVLIAGSVIVIDALTQETLLPLVHAEPKIEILLIGSGKVFAPIDPALRTWLRAKNINADVMDTGAACRTYNVLLAEDRRVAAALLAI